MQPFSNHWKHQKTLRFSDVFWGSRKGALATKRSSCDRNIFRYSPKYSTMLSFPDRKAKSLGVSPSTVRGWIAALWDNSNLTQSRWPLSATSWSGTQKVAGDRSCISASPSSIRSFKVDTYPLVHKIWKVKNKLIRNH